MENNTFAYDVTITIVSYNTCDLLRSCIQSVFNDDLKYSYDIHVIDNASRDGSAQMVAACFPQVKLVINQANIGFSRANNQSWRLSNSKYWLLLNSDSQLKRGSLSKLIHFMDTHPHAALASACLIGVDGVIQHCAQPSPSLFLSILEATRFHKLFPRQYIGRLFLGPYFYYNESIRVGWTWGTCLISRCRAVQQCGPLDESFFMYGEDAEWCFRFRKNNWEVWFCHDAEVIHYGGQSPLDENTLDRCFSRLYGIHRAFICHYSLIFISLYYGILCLNLTLQIFAEYFRSRNTKFLQSLFCFYWNRLFNL